MKDCIQANSFRQTSKRYIYIYISGSSLMASDNDNS